MSLQQKSVGDLIWLHKFDFLHLKGIDSTIAPVLANSFNLQTTMPSQPVMASSTMTTNAICFLDSQQALILALSDPDFFKIKIETNSNKIRFGGCASISIEKDWHNFHKLGALAYTSNTVFALVVVEFDEGINKSLSSTGKASTSALSYLSKQKVYMFENLSGLSFSNSPDFIAIVSSYAGADAGRNQWGFIMFTDNTGMRSSPLWEDSINIEDVSISQIPPTSTAINSKMFTTEVSYFDIQQSESLISLETIFGYNAWINDLCGGIQRNAEIVFANRFDIDYLNPQYLTLNFDQLMGTKLDVSDPWFTTCYPTVKLMVPSGTASRISLISVDKDSQSAVVEVAQIAQADIYIQRKSLNGYGQLASQQLVYYLQIPPDNNLNQKYYVGFYNDPPRITANATSDTGIDPNIFVSLRWAPRKLSGSGTLFEDIDGVVRDILWESDGAIFDPQDDEITFKQLNLTYFYKSELTSDNRVRIRMTLPMRSEFTGIHRFAFQLLDNGMPVQASTTYYVTLVFSLKEDEVGAVGKGTDTAGGEFLGSKSELDQGVQSLPPVPKISTASDWFKRTPYDERFARIKVHPLSTNGGLTVTFTKPIEWPDDVLQQISESKLVNITFDPKTYDYALCEFECDLQTSAELTSWRIKFLNQHSMQIQLNFAHPNLVGYSIHENDQIVLQIDFRSLFADTDTGKNLYGKHVKSVPLQYPQDFDKEKIVEMNQAIDTLGPFVFIGLCFSALILHTTYSRDKETIIWLTLSHLQLLAFLPLMNVPIPAQVNDFSKALTRYFRFDFVQDESGSLMTNFSEYIFDFQEQQDEMPIHFEQLGFLGRNSFTTVMGLNLLHCAIIVPVVIVLIVSYQVLRWIRGCRHVFFGLRDKFFNSFYIRFGLETYMVYSITNMLTLQRFSFYNWATSMQSVTSALHTLLLLLMPLIIIVFYLLNFHKIAKQKSFTKIWSNLYAGMIGKTESSKRKVPIYFQSAQLTRKFLFAFSVLVMRDQWTVQLFAISFSSMIVIQITNQPSLIGPYLNRSLNKLQVFVDVMLIALIDFMVAFNGGGFVSVENQNSRFAIGQAYMVFLITSVAALLLAAMIITFKVLTFNLRTKKVTRRLSNAQKRLQIRKKITWERTQKRMERLRKSSLLKPQNYLLNSGIAGENTSEARRSTHVVMQNTDNKITVRLDQEKLENNLAGIEEEESSNSKKDQSSLESVDSFQSDFTESCSLDETNRNASTHDQNNFVMGMSLLPREFRQRINMRQRPKSVPADGRRPKDKNVKTQQLLGLLDGEEKPNKIVLQGRPQTSMPRAQKKIQETGNLDPPKQQTKQTKQTQSTIRSTYTQTQANSRGQEQSRQPRVQRTKLASMTVSTNTKQFTRTRSPQPREPSKQNQQPQISKSVIVKKQDGSKGSEKNHINMLKQKLSQASQKLSISRYTPERQKSSLSIKRTSVQRTITPVTIKPVTQKGFEMVRVLAASRWFTNQKKPEQQLSPQLSNKKQQSPQLANKKQNKPSLSSYKIYAAASNQNLKNKLINRINFLKKPNKSTQKAKVENDSNLFDEPSHSLRNLLGKQEGITRLANFTTKEEFKQTPNNLNGNNILNPAPLKRSRSLRNNTSPLYALGIDVNNFNLEDHLEKSTKRLQRIAAQQNQFDSQAVMGYRSPLNFSYREILKDARFDRPLSAGSIPSRVENLEMPRLKQYTDNFLAGIKKRQEQKLQRLTISPPNSASSRRLASIGSTYQQSSQNVKVPQLNLQYLD